MNRVLFPVFFLFLSLMLCGCANLRSVEAPGCRNDISNLSTCFGKYIVTDVRVHDTPNCLFIRANNCNGGEIWVENQCGKPYSFEGINVPQNITVGGLSQPNVNSYFDVVENGTGYYVVYSRSGPHMPAASDTQYTLTGIFENKTFSVDFVKTGLLC